MVEKSVSPGLIDGLLSSQITSPKIGRKVGDAQDREARDQRAHSI